MQENMAARRRRVGLGSIFGGVARESFFSGVIELLKGRRRGIHTPTTPRWTVAIRMVQSLQVLRYCHECWNTALAIYHVPGSMPCRARIRDSRSRRPWNQSRDTPFCFQQANRRSSEAGPPWHVDLPTIIARLVFSRTPSNHSYKYSGV